MRVFILSFCVGCFLAYGEEGGDFFPAPDGFKWPEGFADIGAEEAFRVADLSEDVREGVLSIWPDEELPENVRIRKADLNQDGKPELFVYIPEYSGTGGSTYEVLTLGKGKYGSIGSVQGAIQLLTPVDGWLQIEGHSRGGGGLYTRYLLRYVDGQYDEVRNERHDYITNTVTVRKGSLK